MPPEPECEDAKRNFTLASQAKQSEVRGKSAHGRAAAKGLQPRATAAPTGTNQGDFVMLFFFRIAQLQQNAACDHSQARVAV
jgi:hypothetical protein